jgi:oligopeptide/dipeptide ABC transporter ATP-binding protein
VLAARVDALLAAEGLVKRYQVGQGFLGRRRSVLTAVGGVSLHVGRGETLGLVGESGCGKTTIGRLVLRLEEADEGRIIFGGDDITDLSRSQLIPFRRRMQIVFQDPVSSLNPRQRIGSALEEPLIIHRIGDKGERRARVAELLDLVGLAPGDAVRYPHQFSGGQRQRVGIARALALQPELIVADEPVSALDVSIQAQIVNLLLDLQRRFGLAYLFISHDLSLVRHVSDRVAVMYLGRIVEEGAAGEVFDHPAHPYTAALLEAIPIPDPETKRLRIILPGDLSATPPVDGCPFEPRCPERRAECATRYPAMREVAPGHTAACLFAGER